MAICIVSFSQVISLMPALARAGGDLQWITSMIREETQFDSSLDALNDEGDMLEIDPGKGVTIQFNNVFFEYDTPEGPCKVLKGLDLYISPGEMMSLTGTQDIGGANTESAPFGGTTILHLIQRLYDVTSGELVSINF